MYRTRTFNLLYLHQISSCTDRRVEAAGEVLVLLAENQGMLLIYRTSLNIPCVPCRGVHMYKRNNKGLLLDFATMY